MEYGIEKALGEITLVLFTTLGPAGAFAFAVSSLYATFGNLTEKSRGNLSHYLIVPIIISMTGLIASATHLGTPSNALYVLSGIGRSPLSNEVAAGVLFLALAALLWLSTFSLKTKGGDRKALTVIAAIAGILFIQMVSTAYSVKTIPTWNSVYAPFSQWMFALTLGSIIALLTLHWAEVEGKERVERVLIVCFMVAFALSLVSSWLQHAEIARVANSWISGDELMPKPMYGLLTCSYIALELVAAALVAPLKSVRRRIPYSPFAACVVSALGVFIMRFSFYVTHMTVGF